MNLKETTERLFADSRSTPVRGLSAIAEAEKYLQQAYEGRYFFELIQNVRDANKEIGQDGEIFVVLHDRILSIANTGAEFSTEGIEGITTIGQSTKHSQEYIGFKGIGFKSIQEITGEPRIVTAYGSVCFDRKLTLKLYNDPAMRIDQVPLFYFPHFREQRLPDADISRGIVTKIELPLREHITTEKILGAFSEIQIRQLILLGNIKTLSFEYEDHLKRYTIDKNPQKKIIEVKEDDKLSLKFKYFTPDHKVVIPDHVIQALEGKEKELFANSSAVDISIVMELTETGQIKPIEGAKLFLFYPLKISSGFRFIIHSYFIVNPERAELRDSRLNDFLFETIGKFIGNEMLRSLKKTSVNTNRILCFNRNRDADLTLLYDTVVAELKQQRFIYDSQTHKYYFSSEVIVADDVDKGLFPDGKLGGKQLVYTDDDDVIRWLQKEFGVKHLSADDIAAEIEHECKRQLKAKNVNFFQHLYNYVSHNDKINLTGKKVLLTDQLKLVSSEADVFYGGKRTQLTFAASIRKHIHFIHRDINITELREGRSRIGITEFNMSEFVRRLTRLFGKGIVPNEDLLNALYNLPLPDAETELEIRKKVLMPIRGTGKWLSPLTNPVYFATENLLKLYPKGNFVDETLLHREGDETDTLSVKDFLKKYGVWDIPAVYIVEQGTMVSYKENRDMIIQWYSRLATRPFYIYNDRVLSIPAVFDPWFTTSILENWHIYRSFMVSGAVPVMLYGNNRSTVNRAYDHTIRFSSFVESLSALKWIVFHGENEAYSIRQIIGIKPQDFHQPYNQVLRRYVKLLPVNFDLQKEFITLEGMIHLDGDTVENFANLLNFISGKYETDIPGNKEFVAFYNKLLGKLFDFYISASSPESIAGLKDVKFLAIDETTGALSWTKASKVFYIDDKPNYDLLPLRVRERLQPQFTNRDKTTFGRIAGRIGRKFSNSIHRELVESEAVKTGFLVSYFKFLPEAVALLESSLENPLTQYFELLKSIRVFEKETLEVSITVEGSEEFVIPVSYFIDTDADADIHLLDSTTINKSQQMAETLNEWFVNLLGRDLRKFRTDLLRFLNAPDKKAYLRDDDITEGRVTEIRDYLSSLNHTSDQSFWIAVFDAKVIGNYEHVFDGTTVDTGLLSVLLGVDMELLQRMTENFNFHQTSSASNITLLAELLPALSLTLEGLNKTLFPKIDYREYYEKKLAVLQHKLEKGFNFGLYSYLKRKSRDEQARYQDHLDDYKRNFEFSIPVNTLELNVKHYFLQLISNKYPFLTLTMVDLEKDHPTFNPVEIFAANFSLLKSKLAGIEFSTDLLDAFLADNKKRSLLYFKEIDFVADGFKTWLKANAERNKPKVEEEDLAEFLRDFTGQTGTGIEEISTGDTGVILTPDKPGHGGGGRRFDGGAADQNKKLHGLVAEMVVFENLKKLFADTVWVSKFASKVPKTHPGYNPEGLDGLGYDIEYTDPDGNKYFVEVKSSVDSINSFEISSYEVNKARHEKDFYRIIFVSNSMDNEQRKILDLGNLFMLDSGEDFLANSKFTAVYKNFEIYFVEK